MSLARRLGCICLMLIGSASCDQSADCTDASSGSATDQVTDRTAVADDSSHVEDRFERELNDFVGQDSDGRVCNGVACESDGLSDQLGDEPTCTPPTPYVHNGQCVECTSNAHCGQGDTCNPLTHECEQAFCDLECCYCVEPFPACVQTNGVWTCVACTDDSSCSAGQLCDPVKHACGGVFPADPLCSGCTADGECWDLANELDLVCDVESGCCFDRSGRCDNAGAMCTGEPESGCLVLQAVATAPLPIDLQQVTACTCSKPTPLGPNDLSACLPDGCPDDGCLGATVCASAQMAVNAGLPVDYDGGLCLGLQLLTDQ